MSITGVPVRYLAEPPEGRQSVRFAVTLTPLQPNVAQSFQLNSPGGLSLSQVATLYIDNETNGVPVTVIHGVLNEAAIIPAHSTAIIPTLSNTSGYSVNVSTPAISQNIVVSMTLYNYVRNPGSISNSISNSIVGVQNVSPLGVSVQQYTSPFQPFFDPIMIVFGVSGGGNFIFDSLEFQLDGIQAAAAGVCNFNWAITANPLTIPLLKGTWFFNAPNTNWIVGSAVMKPARVYWPTGFLANGLETVTFTGSATISANLNSIVCRFSLTGS